MSFFSTYAFYSLYSPYFRGCSWRRGWGVGGKILIISCSWAWVSLSKARAWGDTGTGGFRKSDMSGELYLTSGFGRPPPPPFLFPSSSPALQLNYLNILGSVSLQLTGELKWDIKTILERFVLINDNSFQTEICFTRIDNSLHLFFL